jgi:hypothetical protein
MKYRYILDECFKRIGDKSIQIRPFSQFDKRVLANIKKYCPIESEIHKKYDGWIYGNTIYYNELSNGCIMDTIIHEYIHWKRKKSKQFRYRTPMDIFIEEGLATYIAGCICGSKVSFKTTCKQVVSLYGLEIDFNLASKKLYLELKKYF